MDGGSGTRHKRLTVITVRLGLISSAFVPASSAGENRTGCMGEMGEERRIKREDRNHAGQSMGALSGRSLISDIFERMRPD